MCLLSVATGADAKLGAFLVLSHFMCGSLISLGQFYHLDEEKGGKWAILALYPGCDFNLDKRYWEVPVCLSLTRPWIGV